MRVKYPENLYDVKVLLRYRKDPDHLQHFIGIFDMTAIDFNLSMIHLDELRVSTLDERYTSKELLYTRKIQNGFSKNQI